MTHGVQTVTLTEIIIMSVVRHSSHVYTLPAFFTPVCVCCSMPTFILYALLMHSSCSHRWSYQ